MDADELEKECEKFNEFLKKRHENGERVGVLPQIVMYEELIDKLVQEGNSLRQIHDFLKSTGRITSHYPYFWQMYKTLKVKEGKETKKLKTLKAKETKKPKTTSKASSKTPSADSGTLPELRNKKKSS